MFQEITAGDGVIDLERLNDGLLDESISIDELLTNPDLLRLNLLPGGALAAGDVISIHTENFDVLSVTLTEEKVNNGFVILKLSTDLICSLAGDGLLNLTAIVDRGEDDTGGH